MRLSILSAIVLTTALIAAAPASAGTVCSFGGALAQFAAGDVASGVCGVPAGPGEVNNLTVAPGPGGTIVFTDTNPISDGDGPGGCTVSGNSATCPSISGFRFDLGDGNDSATVGAVPSGGVSTGGANDDRLNGGPLGDLLNGGPGNDTIAGGSGDDTLGGGDGNDVVAGGAGNDTLSGDGGADTLLGEDGNDALAGGDGNDTLNGAAGSDALDGNDGADMLSGGADNDSLLGGAGDDTLSGGDGADSLEGGMSGCTESAGDDTLSGDGGDDALCGGAGPSGGSDNDALNGGDGEDTAYYPRSAGVTVSLDNVAGDGEPGESDNVHSDVEDLTGGAGNDTLIGSEVRNVLDGGPGADSLAGGAGDDVLLDRGGDSAPDRLDGGPGDDTLSGGLGGDTYIGGDGEDLVNDYVGRVAPVTVTIDGVADDGQAGEGDNVGTDVEDVQGGAAGDTLVGSDADNELSGGGGDDSISGGGGNDGLNGDAGRDTIDGGAGRDDIVGGGGSDTLKSRDGLTDRVNCNGGTDTVQGEQRDDIAGNCENVDIAPPTAVPILSVQVTRAGFSVVRIQCPIVEASCAGQVIVKTVRRIGGRFITLGRTGYRIRGGQFRVVKAKIAPKDRAALRKARRVKLRVLVTNVNPDTGDSTSTTMLATRVTRGL